MAIGGAILRFGQTGLRVIELLASVVALSIFSYYLVVLTDHHLHIAQWIKAVEGISGAAVLYLLFAVFLTLFLGAIRFFAFIAVVLDICFAACFLAVAILTRGGAGSCKGNVKTPLGSGPSNSKAPGYGKDGFGFGGGENVTYFPNLRRACKLETAVFSVSILLIFLFLLTAVVQVLLARHHQKEKRYGPSPSNNYTSGSAKKVPFWKRAMMKKNKNTTHSTRDAEMATAGTVRPSHDHVRPSHDTAFTGTTGTTMHGTAVEEPKYGQPGYGQPGYGDGTLHNTNGHNVVPAHHATTNGNY